MPSIDTLKTYWLILFEWLKAHGVSLSVISVSSFVSSILFCTIVIAYLPYDYFLPKKRVPRIHRPFILRAAWMCLFFLKNVIAGLLIIVGLIQIPLPGQGILTVLIGILISDIPGKRRLVVRIIRRPVILSAANRIRARFKRLPFKLEEKEK